MPPAGQPLLSEAKLPRPPEKVERSTVRPPPPPGTSQWRLCPVLAKIPGRRKRAPACRAQRGSRRQRGSVLEAFSIQVLCRGLAGPRVCALALRRRGGRGDSTAEGGPAGTRWVCDSLGKSRVCPAGSRFGQPHLAGRSVFQNGLIAGDTDTLFISVCPAHACLPLSGQPRLEENPPDSANQLGRPRSRG